MIVLETLSVAMGASLRANEKRDRKSAGRFSLKENILTP